MNYQHLFHAGNSADVFKHLMLSLLLEHMKKKDSPFCYIDTHAGSGEYDLTQLHIQEWRKGVNLLHLHQTTHPLLKHYVHLTLDATRFPGSPLIARNALRAQDEMILAELNTEAFQALKKLFYRDKQTHIHHLDAYHVPKVLLPPTIRRGVVLIDPPYEIANEFEQLPKLINEAINRFPTAIYALWYPIKSRTPINRMLQAIKKNIPNEKQVIEFCPLPDDVPIRLNGSGMLVINPPWKFKETIHPLLNELIQILKLDPKAAWRTYLL